jgi:hypothetical protein
MTSGSVNLMEIKKTLIHVRYITNYIPTTLDLTAPTKPARYASKRGSAMKRRDFNRLVVGAGVSPMFAKSPLAQMSAEELQTTPSKAVAPSIIIKNSPRTYNQVNVPRKYATGRRRFTIYWTWSYPWEANRDVTELDNRFSTMTEVRRVGWPVYEKPEWSERAFLQGIAGTLELFHLSTVRFQNIVGEATEIPS